MDKAGSGAGRGAVRLHFSRQTCPGGACSHGQEGGATGAGLGAWIAQGGQAGLSPAGRLSPGGTDAGGGAGRAGLPRGLQPARSPRPRSEPRPAQSRCRRCLRDTRQTHRVLFHTDRQTRLPGSGLGRHGGGTEEQRDRKAVWMEQGKGQREEERDRRGENQGRNKWGRSRKEAVRRQESGRASPEGRREELCSGSLPYKRGTAREALHPQAPGRASPQGGPSWPGL